MRAGAQFIFREKDPDIVDIIQGSHVLSRVLVGVYGRVSTSLRTLLIIFMACIDF